MSKTEGGQMDTAYEKANLNYDVWACIRLLYCYCESKLGKEEIDIIMPLLEMTKDKMQKLNRILQEEF